MALLIPLAEHPRLGAYLKAAEPPTSFDHGGNAAMFDSKRNIFIAIAG
ncbi:hypothetical protein [Paracoccus thiocyanatus]|nr:hypothetical protein [Paracoccus thiocyanatus]